MNASAYFRSSDFLRRSAVLFGFALAGFVACTSDEPPTDEAEGDPADCRLIANRCHPYAPESELAHECHETGHDGADPARCTEVKASCLDECPERDPDAGTGGSSGATGTGGTSSGGSAGTSAGGISGQGGTTTTGGAAGESSGGASGSLSGGSSSGGSAGGSQGGAAGSTSTGGSAGTSSGGSGMAGGSGSGGTTGETPCELLGRLCHEAGPGRAEECHEIGHEGDEDVCEEELADCLSVCQDGGM
jgi:hypothetical protein